MIDKLQDFRSTLAELAGLRGERRRNRSTKSGKLVMLPMPAGISGGPMLDSEALANGVVRIVGVFTDKPAEKGVAFGEASPKVIAMLDTITS